jgi:hypothetical protein
VTKPSAVSWPSLGPEFKPQDSKQFTAFLRSLYDALQNIEPGKIILPYTTNAVPTTTTLTADGQAIVYGTTDGKGNLYFRANGAILKLTGST